MTVVLNKSILQPLLHPLFEKKKLKVLVLRDDLIHPFISGNKWRKLKYNIEEFRRQGNEWMVTFGGAYSNHIAATACAGKEFGLNTIGIIRGDELNEKTNPVLLFARGCGMKLIFVSRDKYKSLRGNYQSIVPELKTLNVELHISELRTFDSNAFILPEGGSNFLAVKGCEEIIDDIPVDFDYICCACGTGTTIAGIINGIKNNQEAIGIAVLKGDEFLQEEVRKYSGEKNNFQLIHDYHFGGYAKSTQDLEDFCKSFTKKTSILIEPVYTGKLFFAIYDLIQKDFFPENKTIIVVHTGGIAFVRDQ